MCFVSCLHADVIQVLLVLICKQLYTERKLFLNGLVAGFKACCAGRSSLKKTTTKNKKNQQALRLACVTSTCSCLASHEAVRISWTVERICLPPFYFTITIIAGLVKWSAEFSPCSVSPLHLVYSRDVTISESHGNNNAINLLKKKAAVYI